MKPIVSVKVKEGIGSEKVRQAMLELTKTEVLVGIPAQKTGRGGGGKSVMTNAELAFLHTHGVRSWAMRMVMGVKMNQGSTYPEALQMYLHSYGSPQWQVPPRPIIEAAITEKDNQKKIERELVLAGQAALRGDTVGMRQQFKRAGMLAQNLVRAWFTNPKNNWPPNSPSTIKRKGSSKPLIDTGQLRKSIVYVVVKK